MAIIKTRHGSYDFDRCTREQLQKHIESLCIDEDMTHDHSEAVNAARVPLQEKKAVVASEIAEWCKFNLLAPQGSIQELDANELRILARRYRKAVD